MVSSSFIGGVLLYRFGFVSEGVEHLAQRFLRVRESLLLDRPDKHIAGDLDGLSVLPGQLQRPRTISILVNHAVCKTVLQSFLRRQLKTLGHPLPAALAHALLLQPLTQ